MPYEVTIVIRILLSVALGGIIGLERQSKQRPAGFRTHILVCLGSATLMMMSELLFMKYNTGYGMTSDPARIAAQVVSGIGFLGAGTIIHYGNNVRGLTTAASLWAVAAIGLTVGAGFYFLAVSVSITLYGTLFLFNKISYNMNNKNNIELYIHMYNKPKTLGSVNLLFASKNIQIVDMAFINDIKEADDIFDSVKEIITVKFIIVTKTYILMSELMSEIKKINGVIDIERV